MNELFIDKPKVAVELAIVITANIVAVIFLNLMFIKIITSHKIFYKI